MGRRTSAGRSVPGNPVAGVLRPLARASRMAKRPLQRAEPVGVSSVPIVLQPVPMTVAASLQADDDGVVVWRFPVAFRDTPVVAATAVADWPATVVVAHATPEHVVLRAFDAGGEPLPVCAMNVIALPR